ncbi:hypothetical protein MRX96_045628 [Rhipicephalus microplus]
MPDVSSGGCASACIWRARRLCWTVFQQPPASLSVLSQRVVSSSNLSPGGVSTSGCWEKALETAGSVAGLAVFASGVCAVTEGRASAFAVDHGVSCSLETVVEAVKCSIETERVIDRTPLALRLRKRTLDELVDGRSWLMVGKTRLDSYGPNMGGCLGTASELQRRGQQQKANAQQRSRWLLATRIAATS